MQAIFERVPSFLDLGAWTREHILPLFILFRNDDVAPALAFSIFGFAVVLCVIFLTYSRFICIQVGRQTRLIRRIKDRSTLPAAMPEIERSMLRSRYLRHKK